MERKEFLSKLGLGLAAVCTGCSMIACGSDPEEEATPDPGSGGDKELLTANLDSELRNVGDSKMANGVILVRLAQTNVPASFTAVQLACTHQGFSVAYNNAQGKFICPAHGSEFNTTGGVVRGPATSALKHYTISVNGSALAVSA
ncbi:QcrA and Rieske domain-containing protein [Pararcticibacter amylolyticus]|uniref:(2Fe-2S)-binding protein n=1 Tax=Pararcticibacter amylolyticus TaxID=2173175 RepID=A0A2U2PES7_9SPHI|nr:Rieske 2Fe-2S domain-containing protein [Pararcticibacter amylolyticus]PWG79905.1 (2Fe-2S)-binding protein [Pararcticibacter amylolyticus]